MKKLISIAAAAIVCVACGAPETSPSVTDAATVIEVATFKLKDGVQPAQFAPLDAAVETNHVARQPGFVARETGFTDQGDWVVIVHWENLEAADASMASFSGAPAAADFMANLDATTMSMTRYEINN